MTAFVFSLVLLLGVVLFWAFRRLWTGLPLSFEPWAYERRPAVGGAAPFHGATAPSVRLVSAAPAAVPFPAPEPAAPPSAASANGASAPASSSSAASPVSSGTAATPAASAAGPSAPLSPTDSPATTASAAAPAASPSHAATSAAPSDGAPANGAVVPPAPAGATPDNLRRMIGIGPANERHLNGLGITTFAQIAAWTPEDVKRVEAVLAFDGRIARERWVEQAGLLAAGDTAEFLKRFPQAGKGGNT